MSTKAHLFRGSRIINLFDDSVFLTRETVHDNGERFFDFFFFFSYPLRERWTFVAFLIAVVPLMFDVRKHIGFYFYSKPRYTSSRSFPFVCTIGNILVTKMKTSLTRVDVSQRRLERVRVINENSAELCVYFSLYRVLITTTAGEVFAAWHSSFQSPPICSKCYDRLLVG